MDPTLTLTALMTEQDSRITETVLRERSRLGQFIRRRVPDPGEAEDILQDVFQEFVQAYRLPEPIEQVGAWLFRVARNRIIDRFRKKKEHRLSDIGRSRAQDDGDEAFWLEEALPPSNAGPEAAYARSVLMTALQEALDELPKAQRDVFIAHELDGLSFKEMAAQSGVKLNTLLTRKRQAVLHLRSRLQTLYDEFDL